MILSLNSQFTCHIHLPDYERSVQLTKNFCTCHICLLGLCAIPPAYILNTLCSGNLLLLLLFYKRTLNLYFTRLTLFTTVSNFPPLWITPFHKNIGSKENLKKFSKCEACMNFAMKDYKGNF